MQSSLFWVWGDFSYAFTMQVEQLFSKLPTQLNKKSILWKTQLFCYKERLEIYEGYSSQKLVKALNNFCDYRTYSASEISYFHTI